MCLNLLGLLVIVQSAIFASAYFERCDNSYTVDTRGALIQSPNYPGRYNPGDSCRYNLIAFSTDYEIVATCLISFFKDGSQCSSELFLMSTDADPNLRGATQTCGTGTIEKVSEYSQLSLGFISTSQSGSGRGGYFNCTITLRPKACDCGWSQRGRIVGGTSAAYTEFPSMVPILDRSKNQPFCGGTIISSRSIVTAAHCTVEVSDPNSMYVVMGYTSLSSTTAYSRTYLISKIIQHPYYDPSNEANDISILVTSTEIVFNRGVAPICLPLDTQSTMDYESCKVVGYGTTSFGGQRSSTLLKADVSVIPNSRCANQYPSLLTSQMCTYQSGHDACQYDSGGPVIASKTRQFLLGIISYGNGCGTQYAGVNTRITSFITWIRQNLVGSLCYKPYS